MLMPTKVKKNFDFQQPVEKPRPDLEKPIQEYECSRCMLDFDPTICFISMLQTEQIYHSMLFTITTAFQSEQYTDVQLSKSRDTDLSDYISASHKQSCPEAKTWPEQLTRP